MKKIHNLRIITSEPSKLNVSYGCRICLLMLVKGLLIINQLLHDNIKLLPELLFWLRERSLADPWYEAIVECVGTKNYAAAFTLPQRSYTPSPSKTTESNSTS